MKFYDDNPVECDNCHEMIFAGDTYLKHHEGNFCSEDCLGEFLVELEMSNVEFIDLLTAADHESNWGDMKYHEMKEDGLCDG